MISYLLFIGLLIGLTCLAISLGFWIGRYGPRASWSEEKMGRLLDQADSLVNPGDTEYEEAVRSLRVAIDLFIEQGMADLDVRECKRWLNMHLRQIESAVQEEKEIAGEISTLL